MVGFFLLLRGVYSRDVAHTTRLLYTPPPIGTSALFKRVKPRKAIYINAFSFSSVSFCGGPSRSERGYRAYAEGYRANDAGKKLTICVGMLTIYSASSAVFNIQCYEIIATSTPRTPAPLGFCPCRALTSSAASCCIFDRCCVSPVISL